MLYLLDDAGTMAVVLPHGVLFRGAAEGVIRKYLIKEKEYELSRASYLDVIDEYNKYLSLEIEKKKIG